MTALARAGGPIRQNDARIVFADDLHLALARTGGSYLRGWVGRSTQACLNDRRLWKWVSAHNREDHVEVASPGQRADLRLVAPSAKASEGFVTIGRDRSDGFASTEDPVFGTDADLDGIEPRAL
jgi:hypothetical protein